MERARCLRKLMSEQAVTVKVRYFETSMTEHLEKRTNGLRSIREYPRDLQHCTSLQAS